MEFEVRHGNEDTMREMLRIKRSVQATYNTQVCALTFNGRLSYIYVVSSNRSWPDDLYTCRRTHPLFGNKTNLREFIP
jgi:hypothetical protein